MKYDVVFGILETCLLIWQEIHIFMLCEKKITDFLKRWIPLKNTVHTQKKKKTTASSIGFCEHETLYRKIVIVLKTASTENYNRCQYRVGNYSFLYNYFKKLYKKHMLLFQLNI